MRYKRTWECQIMVLTPIWLWTSLSWFDFRVLLHVWLKGILSYEVNRQIHSVTCVAETPSKNRQERNGGRRNNSAQSNCSTMKLGVIL